MKRVAPLLLAAVSILVAAVFAGAASADDYHESICQPPIPVHRRLQVHRHERRVHRPRRADRRVPLEPAGHRRRRPDVHHDAAEEPAGTAQPGRHRRHVGLPAARDVLARPDDVRHGVVPELHATPASRTATRTRSSRSTNPKSPKYLGKGPGQRVHGAAVLRARLGPAVRRLRLQRHAVVREPDDRQPVGQRQHRRAAERRLPEQPLPGRRGAGQLGVHHEERPVAGAGQPAGAVRRPEPDGPQPGPEQGPADELRRHDPRAHARHARPATGSTSPTSPPAAAGR